MKYIYLSLILVFFLIGNTYAQTGREVHGTLIDSTKQTLPGSTIKLKTDLGDSTTVATDMDGKFNFSGIKGTKITLYISSFGYQAVIKHYSFAATDNGALNIPPIVLRTESKQLKEVVIVGVNPVKFKEDTVEYKIAAYPVRENAPVEDVLKKMPGVDVDANGNVTAQGKSITKIRINGKDFMGGDVQSATKNLPADILESVQVIDDYGDQANLTGVKTGEPNKILNFTIRADKNYGYSLQATAGDGEDALRKDPGVVNKNRYLGSVNFFSFKGNRQITVLGNINNINTNTFSFINNNRGPGGGNRGGGSNSLASVKDGITNANAIGTNYRDQWGKYVSVYGFYSYSDNSTLTNSNVLRTNTGQGSTNNNNSTSTDHPANHSFNFNFEYKPDTINYLKISPSFSYSSDNSNLFENVIASRNNAAYDTHTAYTLSNSSSPNFSINGLFNHRFAKRGRNFSFFFNASTAASDAYSNPVVNYTVGTPNVPSNQVINTDNYTTSYSGNLSYLEPIGKVSFLEFNYNYSHSYTSNDKETDTLSLANTYNNYQRLSNNYNFTFITHRAGLNYRIIGTKYNVTLGLGIQPSILDGRSLTTGKDTHVSEVNYVPAARFLYNFSRNQSFSFTYNGSSSQPTFNQLQPVVDLSNASYPVQGNPDLKQVFNNNLFIRYNSFGIESGNILFAALSFNQVDNYIATRTTTYGNLSSAVIAANPGLKNFRNALLQRYVNADGYYKAGGFLRFSKPWDERKYTISVDGNISYTAYPAFVDSVSFNNVQSETLKNLAKSLTFTPGVRFRVDLQNIIDAQASANYSINKTTNCLTGSSTLSQNTNIRALTLGLTGKNYFGDWTLSYDYNKQINSGYTIPVTNPSILSAYVERRFLPQGRATIRLAAFDLFNENKGFSVTGDGTSVTQTNVNRLGRYYMLTFALRLQKFAGKAPTQDNDRRGEGGRGGGDRPGGGRSGGGGFGGGNGGGGFGGGGGPQ